MLSAAERIAKLEIQDTTRKLILLGLALGSGLDGWCRNDQLAYDLAGLPWEETYWHIVKLCCDDLCEISEDGEPGYRLIWENLEARYARKV